MIWPLTVPEHRPCVDGLTERSEPGRHGSLLRSEDAIDVAVIGSGVVGAAIASRLAARGLVAWVLEKNARAGGETTERNSGVIHAGLYYPERSLKTRLCIEGRRMLYAWCEERGVPHMKCGKLVVASDESEVTELEKLHAHATRAGVEGLRLVTKDEMMALEPNAIGIAALFSRETGVVDPAALTSSLLDDVRAKGGEVLVAAPVTAIERGDDAWRLETGRGEIFARAVVNAAGLHADEIARLAGVGRYEIHPCRGDYFVLRTRAKYRRLIYPVKKKGAPGLGVHLTIDLAGAVRLGPDAEYVPSKQAYADPAKDKRAEFAAAARKILGEVRAEDLEYDSCGLRPKLRAPSESEEKDFVIAEDLPRFIDVIGIESPGLTSALAIAVEVDRLL
jgi:L-2-hydroxyglutarate oxidase LhgO